MVFFGLKYEVDSKKYRKQMYLYFRHHRWQRYDTITSVKVFKKNTKTYIEIESYQPGILIGKAGQFINGLKKWLSDEFNEDIVTKIEETNIWKDIFR